MRKSHQTQTRIKGQQRARSREWPRLLDLCAGAWWDLHAHSTPCHRPKALSTKLGIQMPRRWCYLCQYPKEVPRGTQRLSPQFLPTSGAAGAAQNEGPRDGECSVGGEEKSRTRLPGSQVTVKSVCEVCNTQVGHLDGTRPGTLCRRWAENAQRMLKWRQKSKLSFVGWIRSRGGEGLEWGWMWSFSIGTVWAGPKAERAWPGLGVGPKRGGSRGGERVGVRAGGVRRAGLTAWGIPLRVRSPALLASVCERSAKFSALVAAAPSAPAATTRPAPGAARLRRPAVRQGMARVKTGSRGRKGRL